MFGNCAWQAWQIRCKVLVMDENVLHALGAAPKVVERILRVFPHDRLDDRIDADRFTAREVIAHLTDYEQTVLDRIRAATHSPGRDVPWYEPDARAAQHEFSDKEVFHEAEVYESRRGMTLDFLRSMDDGVFNNGMKFPDGTTLTISQYISNTLCHDMMHLEQLSSYLATEVASIS